jgi:hypothetical protein
MQTKVSVAIFSVLTVGGVAYASPNSDLSEAIARTHDDGIRVAYHAAETVIAERDLASAQLEMQTTHDRWDAAVRADHSDDAAKWAEAHMRAQDVAKEASNRAIAERAERDLARADFRRDAEEAMRAKRAARSRG